MLYNPTLVDDSLPALPLIGASCTACAPGTGEEFTISLPLMGLAISALVPSVIHSTALTLPLLDCRVSPWSPGVLSSFVVIPSATTGLTKVRRRAPNPYSQTEMRRASQLARTKTDDHTILLASINENIQAVQSDLDTLEEEMDSVLESSDTTNSAEVDESIAIGQCLYMKNTGHVGLARANAAATRRVVGIAIGAAVSGHAVKYNSDGKLTKADWTSVAGSSSLSPGADYFLSPDTAGSITSTAPTATGAYVVRVGNAKSTVIFNVEIETSILL